MDIKNDIKEALGSGVAFIASTFATYFILKIICFLGNTIIAVIIGSVLFYVFNEIIRKILKVRKG